MRIYENFRDVEFSKKWDMSACEYNPIRGLQLEMLVQLIKKTYQEKEVLLDLGYGSGLVEEEIYRALPSCKIVGIDDSSAMMHLAEKRLAKFKGNFQSTTFDLEQIEELKKPADNISIIISVQTIHNLTDTGKSKVFQKAFEWLNPGGLFLIMDRIAMPNSSFFKDYQAMWDKMDADHKSKTDEGENYADHLEQLKQREDRPITLNQHTEWLQQAGFEVACLHLHTLRALIAARKPV